jgi:hypothetical protein
MRKDNIIFPDKPEIYLKCIVGNLFSSQSKYIDKPLKSYEYFDECTHYISKEDKE